jgi:lysophospholipase L1-like esterase
MNRGVSGDTIRHLEARWQRDVIRKEPDVLSISIGVNDVWRQLQEPRNPEEVPLDEFEATYRRLLERTRDAVGCRFVLCEATIIGERRTDPHNPIVDAYNACIANLAQEYGALLVPMNRAFWRAIDANPSRAWTTDGVHPLSNGHMLMALTLFQALGGAL